jgi:hypothetical protein
VRGRGSTWPAAEEARGGDRDDREHDVEGHLHAEGPRHLDAAAERARSPALQQEHVHDRVHRAEDPDVEARVARVAREDGDAQGEAHEQEHRDVPGEHAERPVGRVAPEPRHRAVRQQAASERQEEQEAAEDEEQRDAVAEEGDLAHHGHVGRRPGQLTLDVVQEHGDGGDPTEPLDAG